MPASFESLGSASGPAVDAPPLSLSEYPEVQRAVTCTISGKKGSVRRRTGRDGELLKDWTLCDKENNGNSQGAEDNEGAGADEEWEICDLPQASPPWLGNNACPLTTSPDIASDIIDSPPSPAAKPSYAAALLASPREGASVKALSTRPERRPEKGAMDKAQSTQAGQTAYQQSAEDAGEDSEEDGLLEWRLRRSGRRRQRPA